MICVRHSGRAARVPLLIVLLACINASSAFAQGGLPSPWVAQDIGSPAIAGTVSFNQGTFNVDAAGADVFGTTDQFHFTYRQVSGDVDIIARVDSLGPVNEWSKAGVMIRGSLSAGSAHAFAHVTASHGLRFLRRLQTGGVTTSTAGPAGTAPRWVRLVRAGTKVTSYSSADGTTWAVIGSDTLALGTTAYVGLAVVSCNTGMPTGADFSQVSVLPLSSSLPASQQAQDIGSPALAGSTTYSGGTYTIKAAGADIWDVADQFHFVYQPVTGDVTVVAHVASITNANAWSKAGVMVRETLAAGSRHALSVTSAASGYAFQRRIDPNGFSTNTSGGAGAPPGWVRLVRTGDRFDSYRSADGSTWQLMGSDTIPMASAVYVGLAATSHNASATTTAVIDSLTVSSSVPVVNQPPTVSLTAPANNSTYTAPATMALTASASDPEGKLARVEFYNGSTLLSTDTTFPYSFSWSSVGAGTYQLKAIAYDTAGLSGTSAVATVVVNSVTANKPPTVSLTAPANNATYTAPATISLTASASDPEGKLARVDFYTGTTLLKSDTTPPYSASWSSVGVGTYQLKAIAYDTAGLSGSSAVVTVVVNSTANKPPTVSLTAPANNATYTAPATVGLTAAASDPEGKLARVEFYNGTTLLGTDTTLPYAFTWSSVPAGTYQLKAVAYDTAGSSGTSATMTITVGGGALPPPTGFVFHASPDHSTTLVTSYKLDVFTSAANPNTATPVASTNVGKPTPDVNGDITIVQPSFFSALAPGNYIATVSAIGPGGTTRSAQVAFSR